MNTKSFLDKLDFFTEKRLTYQLEKIYLGESLTFKNDKGVFINIAYCFREFEVCLRIKHVTTVLLDFNNKQYMLNYNNFVGLSEFDQEIKAVCQNAKTCKTMTQKQFSDILIPLCLDFLKKNIDFLHFEVKH